MEVIGESSGKTPRIKKIVVWGNMAEFKNVIVIAPVLEAPHSLSETHPRLKAPDCRVLPSAYCVSQRLCERTKWKREHRLHKLSKDVIGPPSNFKHLCHIGWNPQSCLATNLDPELKIIFAQAGVLQDSLNDKQPSEKISETIEKQEGRDSIVKETMTKGLSTKSLDHALPCSRTPSEQSSVCSSTNKPDCQTLRPKDGFKDVLAVLPSISKSQGSLCNDLPSFVSLAPCMSPSKRASRHKLILNLKEVQLKKSKSDNLTPLSQDVLMHQTGTGKQLKLAALSRTSPSDGIVAALKDLIQKRHETMHVSDEGSDLENGDEWDF